MELYEDLGGPLPVAAGAALLRLYFGVVEEDWIVGTHPAQRKKAGLDDSTACPWRNDRNILPLSLPVAQGIPKGAFYTSCWCGAGAPILVRDIDLELPVYRH